MSNALSQLFKKEFFGTLLDFRTTKQTQPIMSLLKFKS